MVCIVASINYNFKCIVCYRGGRTVHFDRPTVCLHRHMLFQSFLDQAALTACSFIPVVVNILYLFCY